MSPVKYYLPVVIGLGMVAVSAGLAHSQGAASSPVPSAAQPSVDPGQFLAQSPNGGGTLVSQIRNLLMADKSSLSLIIGAMANANQSQQEAAADGLSQAAKAYVRTDPVFATQIQQAVVASGFPELIRAFASLSGDTGTAATGGGGGGGGGAGGGGGPTSSPTQAAASGGAPTQNGTPPTRNGSTNLLTGGSVGGASVLPASVSN